MKSSKTKLCNKIKKTIKKFGTSYISHAIIYDDNTAGLATRFGNMYSVALISIECLKELQQKYNILVFDEKGQKIKL